MTDHPTDRLPFLHRIATWSFAAALATLLAACGGGDDAASPVAPTISTQPNDVSVVEGSAATLSVTAAGSSPLAYQWASSVDGITYTNIGSATAASYGTGATTLSQNGTRYRVVVSNSAGSITSSAVRLTVTAAIVAPAIAVQPADVTVTAPMTATFNVTATGTTPSFQWQFSTNGGVTFAAVAGAADAPTLAVANTTTAQSAQRFRVRVSNSAGTVTSTAAVLTVNPTPMAPTITTQPAAQTIVAGGAASFTVAAAGTPAPSIQWRINGTNLVNGAQASGVCSGATVAGASTATLALTAVPATCSGALFSAVASNGVLPNATSGNAALTVNVPMPPVITVQPANQSVITDATATFSVTATGPALTYQWKKNGVNIVGATAATYTTPAVTFVDEGALYTVVISNVDGTVTSGTALLSLMASADQTVSRILSMTGGNFQIVWNLNSLGPQTAGTFANYDSSITVLSPLTNGPQNTTQTPRVNLTTTLPIVLSGPNRTLKNGVILVTPSHDQTLRSSYVGSSVRVDSLADDNVTVAYSQLRSAYSFVSLTGDVKTATPAEMKQYLNSFFTNPAVLNSGINYQAGAGYVKFSSVFLGDRYNVFDCAAATTGAAPSPCYTAPTTLASALAAGIPSASDGVTYFTGDGAFSTVGGVQVWVATMPRSLPTPQAVQHRIYFALNGNVYTGSLTRDGQPFGGSYYILGVPGAGGVLTAVPFNIRLNQAATLSLKAAMAI